MEKDSKIYITGHTGMVGKATLGKLRREGYGNLVLKASKELDLRNQKAVETFFEKEKPEYVYHFAAKVGGIAANIRYPAKFLFENLMITSNLIHTAYRHGVKKLLYLGSSCVYPRECPQPMKEEYLLTGKLEPTNEGYALAKIAGLKLCEYYNREYKTNFISLMPSNIYGPGDHFGVESSHVISALIHKFHRAKVDNEKSVTVWGTGNARREFLFVEDVADACLVFMENYDAKDLPPFINVGVGKDIAIKELAYLIKNIIGFDGEILFGTTKPDGMPRKLLDIARINKLGWVGKISLREGIKKTYEWYLGDAQSEQG
jgi:GDP-L-fucose synthase